MNSGEESTIFRRYGRRHSSPPPPPPPPHFQVLPSNPPSPLSMALLHRFKKPNPRLLSFLLQALIMILVITVFFLFMGFAAIFLVHICIVGRTLHRTRTRPIVAHFSYTVQDDLDYLGTTGLSPLDIQRLPSFNYAKVVESGSSTRDCAVCLEGFREGERFRILQGCNHAFHANCIDAWLNKASACPICRGAVQVQDFQD